MHLMGTEAKCRTVDQTERKNPRQHGPLRLLQKSSTGPSESLVVSSAPYYTYKAMGVDFKRSRKPFSSKGSWNCVL